MFDHIISLLCLFFQISPDVNTNLEISEYFRQSSCTNTALNNIKLQKSGLYEMKKSYCRKFTFSIQSILNADAKNSVIRSIPEIISGLI